jgi:histone-arginine methyltransferase CARM1
MIESYLTARERFLKPGGKMYPSNGTIFLCPFSDAGLYSETLGRARFWDQGDFYGVDLTALSDAAREHHFSQPVIGTFDPRTLVCSTSPCFYPIDFMTAKASDLHHMRIPFRFVADVTAVIHGMSGWFDVDFHGTQSSITLSTSPRHERTHWHQIRFLLRHPLAVNKGQQIAGVLDMVVNDQRSYDVNLDIWIDLPAKLNGAGAAPPASSSDPIPPPGQGGPKYAPSPIHRSARFRLHEQTYSYFSSTSAGSLTAPTANGTGYAPTGGAETAGYERPELSGFYSTE